ncbi:hypothetical protein [Chitinophaga sp. CF418]|uniref:hypothetical protein n=1 Tax=Chitinophaga sp. CF418 TaxID=1855287 RepID=UPI00091F60A9|nr:hypothetical protein [Chitinophaga sp. CF418]SHN17093.1 hypothetical protein SAMN05216311_106118 [Chitinophaga sp. CF418]
MNYKSSILAVVLLLTNACAGTEAGKNVTNDTVAIEQGIAGPPEEGNGVEQEMMKRIDSTVGAIKSQVYTTRTAYFPPNGINDTMKAMLFFEDETALRIQYSTFEDGGAAVGDDDLYFVKSLGIIRQSQYGNNIFYEGVAFDGRYICFKKSTEDGSFKKLEVPPGAIDDLTGYFLRTAHDLRQLYPEIKFDIPEISLKGDARLKIISAVPLYERPDTNAHKIRLLEDHSIVGFIRAIDSIGNFRDKKWIWYLVRSKTDSGWIVGHPDFVQEPTDENAED